MNKRQRKKLEKKNEQEFQSISNVFQKLKKSIENMFEQMRKNPENFRKVVMNSDLPDESKAYGIALSYISQANQKEN